MEQEAMTEKQKAKAVQLFLRGWTPNQISCGMISRKSFSEIAVMDAIREEIKKARAN
jgi:hypothetical protein